MTYMLCIYVYALVYASLRCAVPTVQSLPFQVMWWAKLILFIHTGKRTEWSPIRSVIIRVVTKSDDSEAGLRFVNHEYDYRLTSDNTKITYQVVIKITIFEKYKK